MLALVKSRQPCRNMVEQHVGGKCNKHGSSARSICLDSFGIILSSEVKMLLSWRYREGISLLKIYDLFHGREVGVRSEWPSCFCYFLKLLEVKIFSVWRYHILGYCVLTTIISHICTLISEMQMFAPDFSNRFHLYHWLKLGHPDSPAVQKSGKLRGPIFYIWLETMNIPLLNMANGCP